MSKYQMIPSIEERMSGFLEVSRRNQREHGFGHEGRLLPTVTLSREFGCEGYPVALKLQAILEKRSGLPWVVMDRALLEKVAEDHHLSARVLKDIGNRSTFLDEMLSTFSPRWKSDKDYYRLLCRQIVSLAEEGNVILVGRGGAVLTQRTHNCFHFRIVAPLQFKIASVRTRMGVTEAEAIDVIQERQRQRDAFLKAFLGRDLSEPTLYHLLFNNARCDAGQIAELIARVVMPGREGGTVGA